MRIPEIKRPWIKNQSQGTRYNSDPHYRSKGWKDTRTAFRKLSTTMPDGSMLLNIYCYDCYVQDKMRLPGSETDHILARKAGGTDDFSNLRTLCRTHHAIKSANEGKQ